MKSITRNSVLEKKIFVIRNHNVMLDHDLAGLYQGPTKALIQAVKRNIDRFPSDFMFQLSPVEADNMRSQIVTGSKRNLRFLPYAFTEQGVAMLSSVLKSRCAIQVNIQIMRAFINFKNVISGNENLKRKIATLEKKYDKKFRVIFDAIRNLLNRPNKPIDIEVLP